MVRAKGHPRIRFADPHRLRPPARAPPAVMLFEAVRQRIAE